MARPTPKFDIPEGPAMVRPHHVQDREISTVAGAPKAWRTECQLQAALDQNRLDDPGSKWTALDRFTAAKRYEAIFDTSEQTGGVDSTQAMNVSRSSRCGAGNDEKARAWDMRITLESHLGQRDRIIVRMVCGQGHTPAEAVRMVSAGYRHTVWARFREALDSLCEAFEAVRQQPGIVNLERRP